MQSKIKLLVPVAIVFAVVIALFFSLYQPAQTQDPLPRIWGHVTYSHQECDYTDYDTIHIRHKGGSEVAKTAVYSVGSPPRQHYEYEFDEFLESAGYYEIWGLQGTSGCGFGPDEIYFDGTNSVRHDVDFDIAPDK